MKTTYKYLKKKLATIYNDREADNIAQIIFEDAFGIFNPTHSERIFTPAEEEKFSLILSELMQYRPWQYVLGYADFYGLKFYVNENVLIPRPETEELVQRIITDFKHKNPKILDIGTGSGCIAITVQKELPNATVSGMDKSLEALKIAQKNADLNQCKVHFEQLDILDNENCKKMPIYDVIVSNPPYIQDTETDLMPRQVLDYEPSMALFVTNKDPLQFYKAIANFALEHLCPSGRLYFEINEFFGNEVVKILEEKGFKNAFVIQDIFGRNRMVCCTL